MVKREKYRRKNSAFDPQKFLNFEKGATRCLDKPYTLVKCQLQVMLGKSLIICIALKSVLPKHFSCLSTSAELYRNVLSVRSIYIQNGVTRSATGGIGFEPCLSFFITCGLHTNFKFDSV